MREEDIGFEGGKVKSIRILGHTWVYILILDLFT